MTLFRCLPLISINHSNLLKFLGSFYRNTMLLLQFPTNLPIPLLFLKLFLNLTQFLFLNLYPPQLPNPHYYTVLREICMFAEKSSRLPRSKHLISVFLTNHPFLQHLSQAKVRTYPSSAQTVKSTKQLQEYVPVKMSFVKVVLRPVAVQYVEL